MAVGMITRMSHTLCRGCPLKSLNDVTSSEEWSRELKISRHRPPQNVPTNTQKRRSELSSKHFGPPNPTTASTSTSPRIRIKMGLTNLPTELLMLIFGYAIPDNWTFFLDGQWILTLRTLCSKPFILSFHFAVSQLSSSVLFRIVRTYRFGVCNR
jgi:hypothetical protein